MDLTNDDCFNAFVAKTEQDEKAAQNRSSGGFHTDYEEVEWMGLDDKYKILRIVGNPPTTKDTHPDEATPYDAKELAFSQIIDDSGKRMQLKLNKRVDDINHESLMWRIIDAVKEVEWVVDDTVAPVNGKKKFKRVYKNEKFPWFNKVVHGGYDPVKEDFLYKISKGWSGQEIVVMNVIDRMDDWCKEHKHTKLLSKKITERVDAEGKVTRYPTQGVPSYGFINALSQIVSNNGHWTQYDIAVKRTGKLESPYLVQPASTYVEKGLAHFFDTDGTLTKYVSCDKDYTEEEKTYAKYDISKMYAPTTYTKIFNHLGQTIKAIDADLHKNYYEELLSLVEIEKKEFENRQAAQASSTPAAPVVENDPLDPLTQPVAAPTTPVQESRTVARTVAPTETASTGLTPDKIALLKGWNSLSEEEKAQIIDVKVGSDGKIVDVVYSPTSAPTMACPMDNGGCGIPSPQDFTSCPVCGCKYC